MEQNIKAHWVEIEKSVFNQIVPRFWFFFPFQLIEKIAPLTLEISIWQDLTGVGLPAGPPPIAQLDRDPGQRLW